ncbi:MAG: deoxyribose-phosphate aldolase [Puniceicoccaceae bacterium]
MHPEVQAIAKLFDHAVLQPVHTATDTRAGCELGLKYGVAAICVKPCYLSLAAEILAGSTVAPCAVTAFPHGNSGLQARLAEISEVLKAGATEIDTVANLGLVREGNWSDLRSELSQITSLTHQNGALLKLIFETDFLTQPEIAALAELAAEVGVDFVKTSTGFAYLPQPEGGFKTRGATEEAIITMRDHVAGKCQLKASGGIRTLDQVLRFRELGCTRIGIGATATLLEAAQQRYQSGSPQTTPTPTDQSY